MFPFNLLEHDFADLNDHANSQDVGTRCCHKILSQHIVKMLSQDFVTAYCQRRRYNERWMNVVVRVVTLVYVVVLLYVVVLVGLVPLEYLSIR